jgi:hypothetical protein
VLSVEGVSPNDSLGASGEETVWISSDITH